MAFSVEDVLRVIAEFDKSEELIRNNPELAAELHALYDLWEITAEQFAELGRDDQEE